MNSFDFYLVMPRYSNPIYVSIIKIKASNDGFNLYMETLEKLK
jgi:hypothetical protein